MSPSEFHLFGGENLRYLPAVGFLQATLSPHNYQLVQQLWSSQLHGMTTIRILLKDKLDHLFEFPNRNRLLRLSEPCRWERGKHLSWVTVKWDCKWFRQLHFLRCFSLLGLAARLPFSFSPHWAFLFPTCTPGLGICPLLCLSFWWIIKRRYSWRAR